MEGDDDDEEEEVDFVKYFPKIDRNTKTEKWGGEGEHVRKDESNVGNYWKGRLGNERGWENEIKIGVKIYSSSQL